MSDPAPDAATNTPPNVAANAGGVVPGQPWGRTRPPSFEQSGEQSSDQLNEASSAGAVPIPIRGDDAALAAALDRYPAGTRFRFQPDAHSDLARALGLSATSESPGTTELPVDTLRVHREPRPDPAGMTVVNLAVLGHAPQATQAWHRRRPCVVEIDGRERFAGSATGVVVANGQYLQGFDLVPRGHPGDGRLEVHVYCLPPGQRRAMRRRLPSGTQVPHPAIRTFSGRTVRVRWAQQRPVALDGRPAAPSVELEASIEPGRLLLVV